MERPDIERGGVSPGDELYSDASFHEYEDAMEESVESTLEDHRVNGNGDAEMPDSIHFPHPASGIRGESPTGSGARRILARKCTCWEVSVKAGAVLRRLEDTREDLADVRQDTDDLKEYANAKLNRVTRYLGVLAERTRTLDEAARDAELRIGPLKVERKKLYDRLVHIKGNIRVFCRVRPQYESETVSTTTFPDATTVCVNQAAGMGGGSFQPATARKEFELDRVFGPHCSQGVVFHDIQPLMQSVLDGFNVSVLAYGQSGSGKSHTMEGPAYDRGLIFRCFEEVVGLSNTTLALASKYTFGVTMLEIYNEQVQDLLGSPGDELRKKYELRCTETEGVAVMGLTEEKVEKQAIWTVGFVRLRREGERWQRGGEGAREAGRTCKGERGGGMARSMLRKVGEVVVGRRLVSFHVRYVDVVTGQRQHSKLHLADLASSERLQPIEAGGERLTESLHITKALSCLGDCLSALTARVPSAPPFTNSMLTALLSDSMADPAKVVLMVTCSPGPRDGGESVAALQYAQRARNVELTLGSKDSIKKWRDTANDAKRDAYERERACERQVEEVLSQQALREAAEQQAMVLFEELQKSWVVAGALQGELLEEQARSWQLQREVEDGGRRLEVEQLANQKWAAEVQRQKGEEEVRRKVAAEVEADARWAEEERRREEALEDAQGRWEEEWEERRRAMEEEKEEELQRLEEEFEMKVVLQQAEMEEEHRGRERVAVAEKNTKVALLEVQIHHLHQQLNDATAELEQAAAKAARAHTTSLAALRSMPQGEVVAEMEVARAEAERLQERLSKANLLTERLHQENERLFKSISEQAAARSVELKDGGKHTIPVSASLGVEAALRQGAVSPRVGRSVSLNINAAPPAAHRPMRFSTTVRRSTEKGEAQQRSPGGEKAMAGVARAVALLDAFEPDEMESAGEVTEKANRLLQQVVPLLSASSPDGVSEMKAPLFEFLDRLQGVAGLEGLAVARIRLAYLHLLFKQAPELKPDQEWSVEEFVTVEEGAGGKMKVNLKAEKKKLFSFSLSGRGEGLLERASSKPRESPRLQTLRQDAAIFAEGHAALALMLAVAEHDEIRRQLRRWLAQHFEFLPLTTPGGGELQQLTDALLEGWLRGAGSAAKESRDALGKLAAKFTREYYDDQLDHLLGILSTLASQGVDDLGALNRLRTQMESVELKRRKTARDLEADSVLLPSERAVQLEACEEESDRLASLFVLEEVLRLCQEVSSEAVGDAETAGARRSQLARLAAEQVPLMLPVDRQSAESSLLQAEAHLRKTQEAKTVAVSKVASLPPAVSPSPATGGGGSVANRASSYTLALGGAARRASAEVTRRGSSMEVGGGRRFSVEGSSSGGEAVWPEKGAAVMERFPVDDHDVPTFLQGEAVEWRAVQFNTKGGGKPIIVKCGATSKLELVIKSAVEKGANPPASIAASCTLPSPSVLEGMSLENMVKELENLPEALKVLAIGKNPISTRERYNRLYKTLAARIPMMMKLLGSELDDFLPGQKQSLTLERGEVGSGEDQVGPMKFVRR